MTDSVEKAKNYATPRMIDEYDPTDGGKALTGFIEDAIDHAVDSGHLIPADNRAALRAALGLQQVGMMLHQAEGYGFFHSGVFDCCRRKACVPVFVEGPTEPSVPEG